MDKEEKGKRAAWEAKRFRLWIWFLHLLSVLILGFSLFPMIYFLYGMWHLVPPQWVWLKVLVFSFSLGIGFFLFGFALILFCVFFKNLLGFRISPGLFTLHSWEGLRWIGYNSMILIANAAFLDVLRVSPFQTLFYRLMGAKIGNDVNINTAGLADLSMLEIGDRVAIGGGVALICHAVERGFLRLAPTKIGNGASIGIGSVIMPDCEIGEGASIGPCSYLPKGTRIPPKGAWGGNPIRDLRAERRDEALKSS
jgi:acetyltransferase-like isoleucine patch superfamily enzyme